MPPPRPSHVVAAIAAGCLAAACSFNPNGVANGSDGGANIDGTPMSDAELTCVALLPSCVDAFRIQECMGATPTERDCPFACTGPDGSAICGDFTASNGTNTDWLVDTSPATIPTNTTVVIDTDTGEIWDCAGGITIVREAIMGPDLGNGRSGINYQQAGATPGTGVFVFQDFDVPLSTQVRAIGSRALAIFSENNINVDGQLIVTGGVRACDVASACAAPAADQADPICAGPGGSPGGRDDSSGQGSGAGGAGVVVGPTITPRETGGGGGGFGGDGGRGGSIDGGGGGMSFGTANLSTIIGGSGGGGGADGLAFPFSQANGGGGGGAVQLTAMRSILIAGDVIAGGQGGAGSGVFGGGGGGGAGGAILLEAPSVTVSGNLAANGGGGGSGGNDWGLDGGSGISPTPGGADGNAGGTGGARNMINGSGGVPADDSDADDSGGGGGGAGRLHVRHAFAGWNFAGATISPAEMSAENIAQP